MSVTTPEELPTSDAIHKALASRIKQRILSGELALGAALESESELCRRYGVSRTPVRHALALLAEEGLIRRIQGKGSFVSATASAGDPATNGDTRLGTARVAVMIDTTSPLSENRVAIKAMEGLNAQAAKLNSPYKLTYEFHAFAGESDPVAQNFVARTDVDGLILFPFSEAARTFVANARPGNLPAVSLYRQVPRCAFSQFYVDHERGAYLATDYLIRLGHRRIAFMARATPPSPAGMPPDVVELRLAGYRRALEAAGIERDPSLVVAPVPWAGEIPRATVRLLRQDNPPTALLVGGSAISPECLRALDEEQVRIPEDLSVLVIDRPREATHHDPPIGGVTLPMETVAKLALEEMLLRIATRTPRETVERAVTPELHILESCRPLD